MPEHSAKRIPALDIAKGIAMLLVLYGHAIGELFMYGDAHPAFVAAQMKLIYSFHMPLFFLLSGMVFRAKELREHFRHACALVFTAYIVHVFCWAAEALSGGGAIHWKNLLLPLVELRQFYSVIVWFLAALALVQMAYALLVAGPAARRLAVAAAVIAGFAWGQWRGSNLLELSALLPGLVFFAVGHRAAMHGALLARFSERWLRVMAAVVFTLWSAAWNSGCAWSLADICTNVPAGFVVLMIAGQYGVLPLFLLTALVGSFATLGISRQIDAHLPRGAKALGWVGRRTLQLLVVNALVIFFAHPWMARWVATPGSPLALEAMALAIVAVQLLLVRLFGPLTSTPLRLARYLAGRMPLLRA